MTGQKTKSEPHITTYEISKALPPGAAGNGALCWQPMGTIQAAHGAPAAIKAWAESQGDKFTGGTLRAVPTSRITEREVKVETRRQLTLGAP